MSGIDRLVVIIGKFVSLVSTAVGLGAGATWPGEIAITMRPHIARALARSCRKGVVLVVGTNGKTTTALMIKTILEKAGNRVISNATGANLLNGVVSSFIHHADAAGQIDADVGVFEVDENSLPLVLFDITPSCIVILNLFRDQLDRYGEVDVIIEKWQKALSRLPKETKIIINSDDPGVVLLGKNVKGNVTYFGINEPSKFLKKADHATDSTFCGLCGKRLVYDGIYFSHLGVWKCPSCPNRRPKPAIDSWPNPLKGIYNQYNTLAAVSCAKSFGIGDATITAAFSHFHPAFGRQETIVVCGTTFHIYLSKNPAGFTASLRSALEEHAQQFVFVLNDRIPDGRDVSWIWDVDFEMIPPSAAVTVSGDRVYDMALRMKYAGLKAAVEPSLAKALSAQTKVVFVLATYSAMLEVRKLLTGKKIL